LRRGQGVCLHRGVDDAGKLTGVDPRVIGRWRDVADVVLVEADGSRGLPLKAPKEGEPAVPPDADVFIPVAGMTAIGRPLAEGAVHRPERVAALLGVPHVACYRVSRITYKLVQLLVHVRHFAMPNIILGRAAVPELIQDQVTGENLARELLALLAPERAAALRAELAQVRAQLGEGGAVARAAAAVLARVAPGAAGRA
ncbi:MAG: putative selenium-dependent hydroxylase accessory protein YqeC, partial [Limnochordales bacterium]